MHLRHLGYACINRTLETTTGRTFRLANLSANKVREIGGANLDALMAILRWNVSRDLRFFRVSSAVIPFASHEAFAHDWQSMFAPQLARIRDYVEQEGLRVTLHPGQYTVLTSPDPSVVARSIAELDYQAAFLEAVDPWQGTMTLHVGGAYGDREAAKDRFAQAFGQLSPSSQARLALENDDTTYGLDEVLAFAQRIGVPMIVDYFHHLIFPGSDNEGLTEKIEAVVETWQGRVPKFHLSSARPDGRRTAHADLLEEADLQAFIALMDEVPGDTPYDVMVEAKEKELAILPLRSYQRRALVKADEVV
jgi:UV DNA damage endonuclease